jgi:hypothetical protein
MAPSESPGELQKLKNLTSYVWGEPKNWIDSMFHFSSLTLFDSNAVSPRNH